MSDSRKGLWPPCAMARILPKTGGVGFCHRVQSFGICRQGMRIDGDRGAFGRMRKTGPDGNHVTKVLM